MPATPIKRIKVFSSDDLKKIHSQLEPIGKGYKCLLCGAVSANKSRLSNRHFLKEHRTFLSDNNINIPKNWETLFAQYQSRKDANSELVQKVIGEFVLLSGQPVEKLEHFSLKYFVSNTFSRNQPLPTVDQVLQQYLPTLAQNLIQTLGNFIKTMPPGTLCLTLYNDIDSMKQVINGTLVIPSQHPILLFNCHFSLETKLDVNVLFHVLVTEIAKWESYCPIYSKIIAAVCPNNSLLCQVINKFKERYIKEKQPFVNYYCISDSLNQIVKYLIDPKEVLILLNNSNASSTSSTTTGTTGTTGSVPNNNNYIGSTEDFLYMQNIFNKIKIILNILSYDEVYMNLFSLSHEYNSDLHIRRIKYNDQYYQSQYSYKLLEYIPDLLYTRQLLHNFIPQINDSFLYPKDFIEIIQDNSFWDSIDRLYSISSDFITLLSHLDSWCTDLSCIWETCVQFLNKVQNNLATAQQQLQQQQSSSSSTKGSSNNNNTSSTTSGNTSTMSSTMLFDLHFSKCVLTLFQLTKSIPWPLLALSHLLDPSISQYVHPTNIILTQSIYALAYDTFPIFFKHVYDDNIIESFKNELNTEMERKSSLSELPAYSINKSQWWRDQILRYVPLRDVGSIIFSCNPNVVDIERQVNFNLYNNCNNLMINSANPSTGGITGTSSTGNNLTLYRNLPEIVLSNLIFVRVNGERGFGYDETFGIKQEDINDLHDLLNKSIMNSSYVEQSALIENVKRVLGK